MKSMECGFFVQFTLDSGKISVILCPFFVYVAKKFFQLEKICLCGSAFVCTFLPAVQPSLYTIVMIPKKQEKDMKYHHLLGIRDNEKIVSVVGAGGKTTLVHILAHEAREAGEKAVIATTTHMAAPSDPDTEVWQEESADALMQIWDRGRIPMAGFLFPEKRGFHPPTSRGMQIITDTADCVYVEADGASCMPVKFPAAWEPVIARKSTKIILVTGLTALGKPLDQVCFRSGLALRQIERVRELGFFPNHFPRPDISEAGGQPTANFALDEETMAEILALGYLRFEPTVFLNQADTPELIRRGTLVKEHLAGFGLTDVVIGSLFTDVQ